MTGREKRLSFLIDLSKYHDDTTQCKSDYFAIFGPAGICIGEKRWAKESSLCTFFANLHSNHTTVSQDYAELFLNISRRHHQHVVQSEQITERKKRGKLEREPNVIRFSYGRKNTHHEHDREWKWGNFLIITCFHSIKIKIIHFLPREKLLARARVAFSDQLCAGDGRLMSLDRQII